MTTREDIRRWLLEGQAKGADYTLIVCDTFDWEDYPVHAAATEVWDKYDEHNGKNMQRIMEVYDLNEDLSTQLFAPRDKLHGRVFNLPSREAPSDHVEAVGNRRAAVEHTRSKYDRSKS
jgi:hypothetical protein